jgi:hypothetical protein
MLQSYLRTTRCTVGCKMLCFRWIRCGVRERPARCACNVLLVLSYSQACMAPCCSTLFSVVAHVVAALRPRCDHAWGARLYEHWRVLHGTRRHGPQKSPCIIRPRCCNGIQRVHHRPAPWRVEDRRLFLELHDFRVLDLQPHALMCACVCGCARGHGVSAHAHVCLHGCGRACVHGCAAVACGSCACETAPRRAT